MSSLVTAVFKATIGLLFDKGREEAAKRLHEGDVTDQKFREFIVGEMDNIKSKLDASAKKDLEASISFFKEGIEFLYDVFEKARPRSEYKSVTGQATDTGTTSSETFSLAKGIKALEITRIDESTTRALANAKKRFERAREKATEAFANKSLELPDRVLAMQYRVMAAILETVDNPEDALPACRVCIEELNSLSGVRKSFNVELKKGFLARLSDDKRGEIISTVCHVNRVMYDVAFMVARRGELLMLPRIDTGEEKVDPLRDERVAKVLRKQGMEHCFVPWSFGQNGEDEHKLLNPSGITTNKDGQFIVADFGGLKVFDSNGKFVHHIRPRTDKELEVLDVATDRVSNLYILVRLKTTGVAGEE